jgi:hypothetical protein
VVTARRRRSGGVATAVGIGGGEEVMQTLDDAVIQLRQCLVASKNRRDMGNTDPNFPDTARYTITAADAEKLAEYFFSLQASDGEFSHLYPANAYRFEVATSGSAGRNVWDFKISQIVGIGNSGPAIFNYHIAVQTLSRINPTLESRQRTVGETTIQTYAEARSQESAFSVSRWFKEAA